MGYYTGYYLALYGEKENVEAFEKDLLKESANDDCVEELIRTGYVYAKLYELEEWLMVVTLRHPDVLVRLSGDGEDSDDMWESRWKGDKYEHQKFSIPPFTTPELILEEEKHV